MSSGSSGHNPKYTSLDYDAVADVKPLRESPVRKGQRSSGKKKAKDGAHASKTEKQSKMTDSSGEKSVGLM